MVWIRTKEDRVSTVAAAPYQWHNYTIKPGVDDMCGGAPAYWLVDGIKRTMRGNDLSNYLSSFTLH